MVGFIVEKNYLCGLGVFPSLLLLLLLIRLPTSRRVENSKSVNHFRQRNGGDIIIEKKTRHIRVMRRTSVGHGPYETLEGLRNDFAQRFAVVEGDGASQTATPLPTDGGRINLQKDLGNMFITGLEDVNGYTGVVPEVKAAVDAASNSEAEVARLEEELAALKATAKERELALRESTQVDEQSKTSFFGYAKQLAELHGQVCLARTIFKAVLMKTVEDVRDDRVSKTDLHYADSVTWAAKRRTLEKCITDLRERKGAISSADDAALQEVETIYREVVDLSEKAAKHVRQGKSLRAERDTRLKLFYAEVNKLTMWCRHQLINLEAMQEPDHIQEYCVTLVENYDVVSQNFAVLLDSVQEYVQANIVPVHKALLEAEEVWFYLQVSTLERLSKTLFEIHQKSLLEVEVERYADYPEHAVKFLRHLSLFLEQGTEFHGGKTQGELDLEKQCEALLPGLTGTFAQLPAEVHSFVRRAKAQRTSYQCFREAILCRLTYIQTTEGIVAESKCRQEKFEDALRELKSWATEASRGESWRDIYSKIIEIKRVIVSDQQALKGHT